MRNIVRLRPDRTLTIWSEIAHFSVFAEMQKNDGIGLREFGGGFTAQLEAVAFARAHDFGVT
jgi:hypothetical protein